MLLLIIAAAILDGIQIQLKFEQIMTTQSFSMGQINKLTASTNENISQISIELTEVNENTTTLNNLDVNQGHITTQLDAAYGNI